MQKNTHVSFEVVDAQDEAHIFFHSSRFDLAFSSAVFLWIKDTIELCQDFVNKYVMLTEAKNTEGKIVYSLPGILIEADIK